ncbi:MAG: hypothetical protein WC544_01915 [Patescibacteria group bacterium]
MRQKRWFAMFFILAVVLMTGGCRNPFGPDFDEISPSSGVYSFELEHIRFVYDTGSNLMTVTNLTSIKSTVRVVRYDDRGDDRRGVKFTLNGYNSSKSYHEEFGAGTEIWIQIWRDGVLTEGYVRLT